MTHGKSTLASAVATTQCGGNALQSTSTAKGVWPVLVIAFLAWISIVVCVDPAGSYPSMPQGPGLTIDEIFNTGQGVYLVKQAQNLGWLNLIPGTSLEAYRPENGYLPDHPPLGRLWLGLHHQLTWLLFPPKDPDGMIVTACARTGSATAFALTILIVGGYAATWYGQATGVMTAVSLLLMPRVFGHAHLASLETVTNLTCTASVLAVANWWNESKPPCWKSALFTGTLFGLALLTKIQAILIPIPLICWALWQWRSRAFVPLLIWSLSACFVFVVGWPYLWLDLKSHLMEYLGRTTNRATLYVWYFGTKYQDKLVPWHYPFVMFGLTVPVVLHGFGFFAAAQSLWIRGRLNPASDLVPSSQLFAGTRRSPSAMSATEKALEPNFGGDVLLLSCIVFPLALFAAPGIAVYDCERLFLPTFPLWAIFAGRGWVALWNLIRRRTTSVFAATGICTGILIQTTVPLVITAPCHLCYYNEATSWLFGGPEKAGLEIDYWGVGITRRLLQQTVDIVPEGSIVAVSPTLHPLQAEDYHRQSPILRSHGVKTVEYIPEKMSIPYVLVYRRRADLPDKWNLAETGTTFAFTMRFGSKLAYLNHLTEQDNQNAK